jgi:moderate conductance mechanosensitive channel
MDLGQYFNQDTLKALALPAIVGIVIIVALYFLRRFLYGYIHKLTAKTETLFDDILVSNTKIATLLWCIWLGIWAAYKIAETPATWVDIENKVIPVLFVSFGIYTVVMVIMATFKWYKVEICPKTASSIDDLIMSVLTAGTPIVGGILGVIAILNILGYAPPAINTWLADQGIKIGIMTVVTVTLSLLTILLIPKMIDTAVRGARTEQSEEEFKKRTDTLSNVIGTTVQIIIIFLFILTVLSQLGISITAFLTGSAVLGFAVGFGAQSLVKDVISGLFVIMENQYRRGDVIKIAGESGVVEEINLRRTILRDADGGYHVVPNGEIRVASNYTKRLSKINFNIGVSYSTDLDKAIAVINQVGKEFAEDPKWAGFVTSTPRALRVDNLGQSSVDIKIVGDTKPGKQWDVTGELKLRLKRAFDKEGIDIPFPHTTVIFGNSPLKLESTKKELEPLIEDKALPKKLNN